MITILIADDEIKAKETLVNMLKKCGYDLADGFAPDNAIRFMKKKDISDLSFVRDIVIELEDSLIRENKGALYRTVLEAIEKPLFERILERTEGNQLKAARILGINRNTMRSKMKKFGININKWKI